VPKAHSLPSRRLKGQTADDNWAGASGLFTTYILKSLKEQSGLEEIFKRVRKDVYTASNGRQLPGN
jgi:hypothetical protein